MLNVRAIELWRPVHGLEDLFSVSNCGGVRSTTGPVPVTADAKGYRHVSLAGKGYSVHNLVLEAFICPRPDGAWGLHLDDVKWHNHLSNLYWGSPSDNARDRHRNSGPKTHCPRGHELAEPNLASSKGTRACKACNRARALLRYQCGGKPPEDLLRRTADEYYARLRAARV